MARQLIQTEETPMQASDRRLYRSCEADFRALLGTAPPGVCAPRTSDDICTLLERRRGITIHRYPVSLGGQPYGMVLRGRQSTLILYERHTSIWHQQWIVLHECGHVYYDHQGTETGTAAALRVLVPDLPGEESNAILQRTDGSEGQRPEDERQAEAFATVGLAWLSRVEPRERGQVLQPVIATPDDPEVATVVRRLLDDFASGGWR